MTALPTLLAAADHCATDETLWLLPRGRAAWAEMENAAKDQGRMFHVEHSVTQHDAGIVLAVGRKRR